MLDQVKADLASAEPLPPALRQAALSIADEAPTVVASPSGAAPSSQGASNRSMWWAALAASVLAAAAVWVVWQARRSNEMAVPLKQRPAPEQVVERAGDVRRVGPITVVTIDSSAEFDSLAAQVAMLAATLKQATAEAERLAVEQALDRVLTDYQGTFAVNE